MAQPTKLATRDSVEMAMKYAGYSDDYQWHYFKKVTFDEAGQLRERNFHKWAHVPPNQKHAFLDVVNARLRAGGLPDADHQLLGWRMEKLMRGFKQPSSQRQGTTTTPFTNNPPTLPVALAAPVAPARLPFDPVRDVRHEPQTIFPETHGEQTLGGDYEYITSNTFGAVNYDRLVSWKASPGIIHICGSAVHSIRTSQNEENQLLPAGLRLAVSNTMIKLIRK